MLAGAALPSLITALLSVPAVYVALRLLGKDPSPLAVGCYGYGGLLVAYGIFYTILSATNDLNGEWVRPTIIGFMVGGVLLMPIPLVVRAMREGKKPVPAPGRGGHQHPR